MMSLEICSISSIRLSSFVSFENPGLFMDLLHHAAGSLELADQMQLVLIRTQGLVAALDEIVNTLTADPVLLGDLA